MEYLLPTSKLISPNPVFCLPLLEDGLCHFPFPSRFLYSGSRPLPYVLRLAIEMTLRSHHVLPSITYVPPQSKMPCILIIRL